MLLKVPLTTVVLAVLLESAHCSTPLKLLRSTHEPPSPASFLARLPRWPSSPLPNISSRPNVIVIMTDDQDKLMSGEVAMPNVVEKIGKQGVTYDKHFCTVAWCCPSRVNFFTGRAAHNTNVTSITPPYGGWTKFISEGLNDHWLPVYLQDSGIDTYYIGKLLNGYSIKNYDTTVRPKGWTKSNFLVDPNTYWYDNATFTNDDSDVLENYIGEHTTNVTQKKALAYLERATNSTRPFFLMVAPVAPHVQGGGHHRTPLPPPPEEFKADFLSEIIERSPNFNPKQRSGASWVYKLNRLTNKTVHSGDILHQHRLQNIAGVDAMVGEMIEFLDKKGQLDNTYIIYTSDNGFHIGQHRMHPGKRCPYEEDINIPLYIRGPDVAVNMKSEIFNSHTDMAPTILKMFGIPHDQPKYRFDGQPIAFTKDELNADVKKELITVEFWDSWKSNPGKFSKREEEDLPEQHPDHLEDDHNDGDLQPRRTSYGNTYKTIRIRSQNYSFYYSVWCSGNFSPDGEGDHEFYDMHADQYQMNNLYYKSGSTTKYFFRPVKQLFSRLDALLMVLKSCKEDSCRNPWPSLFPNGEVDSLGDAMIAKYDQFFKNQPKVKFTGCPLGYFVEMEGPQKVNVWKGVEYSSVTGGSSSVTKGHATTQTKMSSTTENSETRTPSGTYELPPVSWEGSPVTQTVFQTVMTTVTVTNG